MVCPDCQSGMIFGRITLGPAGYDIRTFECPQCPRRITTAVKLGDPMASTIGQGWIIGELRAPK
jgi:hypothetical protein